MSSRRNPARLSAAFAVAAALATGCDSKAKQVEQCRYLTGAEHVGECLVARFNWNVQEARVEGLLAQADKFDLEDSLKRAVEASIPEVPGAAYGVLVRKGGEVFAFIDPIHTRDTMRIRQFGGNLCAGARPCIVRFWTVDDTTGFALPLSSSFRASELAEFTRAGDEPDRLIMQRSQ